jgi:CO dehydrogenase nickel-insertion accessory protein CooC1
VFHGHSPEGIHLFVAGKMGDKGPGAGCDGPIAKIARDFRPRFTGETPVTLVDFKAGLEDSARGNIVSLDWIIVVVDPSSAALQMAVNMRDMVDQIKAGALPAVAHLESPALVELAYQLYREARVKGVQFILNRVRDEEQAQYLRNTLAAQEIAPIGVIGDDPSLSTAWLKGEGLPTAPTKAEMAKITAAIEKADEMVVKSAHHQETGAVLGNERGNRK